MGVTDKVLDALRQTVLINERIEQLTKAVAKLEDGQVELRDRLIRIEALIEFDRTAPLLPNPRERHSSHANCVRANEQAMFKHLRQARCVAIFQRSADRFNFLQLE